MGLRNRKRKMSKGVEVEKAADAPPVDGVADDEVDGAADGAAAPFDDGAGEEAQGGDAILALAATQDRIDAAAQQQREQERQSELAGVILRLEEIGEPLRVLDDIKINRAEFNSRRDRVMAELEAEALAIAAEYDRQEREVFHPLVAEKLGLEAALRKLGG
jgi:hypothetical protein